MSFLDEDFRARLDNAPKPNEVIDELFSRARATSEARFFCSIVDLERTINGNKSYLTYDIKRHWVIQQFAEYFSRVEVPIRDFPKEEDALFVRRLQMMAYGQFWECLGIQRLIAQLVSIASGKQYEPRLFLDNRPTTYDLYKKIRKDAERQNLKLASLLIALYSNQIRNAFAHSEFWVSAGYILFENHNFKDYSIPSLRIETWDALFRLTSEFIVSLFESRRNAEADLTTLLPYEASLDEFMRPLQFKKDARGYWSV